MSPVRSGAFLVDRERGLELLRRYQLPDPSDFLLPWLRLAVASGARRVELRPLLWGLKLRFDGAPIPEKRLRSPHDCLFSDACGEGGRYAHLLAGLLGALRQRPRQVRIRSGAGDGRVLLDIDRAERQTLAPAREADSDTVLQVRWSDWRGCWRTSSSLSRVREACALFPVPLTIGGAPASRGLRLPVAFEEQGVRGELIAHRDDGPSAIAVHKLGVRVTVLAEEFTGMRVRARINDDRLGLSASQCGVLRDERLRRVLEVVEARARASL